MTLNVKQQLLRRINELNIEHPRYREIQDMLDALRPDRSLGDYRYKPQHLFILGESGTGKSTLVQNYSWNNPGYIQTDEQGTEYDIKPVVYAEMPNPFTQMEFYQTIVRALGAPQMAGRNIGDVKRQAFTLIEQQRVEMLILDEVNYILGSRYVKNEEAMEAIKHVSNIGNVSVVLVGTPESRSLAEINFQYFRRFPRVELRRFDSCDQEFCELLEGVEQQINPPKLIGLGDLDTQIPQVLHEMSGGLLGALTPILQTTYRKLLQNYNLDDLGNPVLFIDELAAAQRIILGDKEEQFMKMLRKSESSRVDKPTDY